jgi:protease I
MDLTSKSVLMIVAPTDFRDEEYFEPKHVLENYGATIITASTNTVAVSKEGKTIDTDIQIGEIISADHDALLLVGGSGAEIFLNMKKIHSIAHMYSDEGKIVSAICMAPSILANAEMLEDIDATSWEGEHGNLTRKGANLIDKPVVQDGNIITGNGPSAATEFGETIAKALG